MNKAVLTTSLPENRYKSMGSRIPRIGDEVTLDQGFTFADGKAGCLVQYYYIKGSLEYEAEVYECELGPNIE